jgi:16S rRNA (uracil1498-N3)-methyltransferase
MAHTYRFFAERVSAGQWRFEDEEATHALKVLRLDAGTVIEVMDGRGMVGVGTLSVESKSKVFAVDVVETMTAQDPVLRCVILGALKPGDLDDLIAPLVELGCDRVIAFRQDDTPRFRVADGARERWQRLVRAAVKQSKRPVLASIDVVDSLEEALALVEKASHKWILLPGAARDLLTVTQELDGVTGMAALIGGEKGFSAREESTAKSAGFLPVRLGPWVLRARTAIPAAAVFLGMLPRKK